MPEQPSESPNPGSVRIREESALEAERLVRDNIGWMLALAERIVRDRGLAEDAVQEAFVSAFRGLDGFEGRSSLKTWLHRITVNASLTKLRQLNRLAEQPIDDHLPEFDQYGCRIEALWTHLVPLEDVLESEQLRARVTQCMDALPDVYRVVLQLRDIEGYDTKEVAALLGIERNNVKVRLYRARAALKKLLEPVLRGEESK
jgi:RNA polymerase sigma-70 factor (ECF subfamily)